MITARAFAGKHYAVLGLARSGLATVSALLASGARVTAWDDKLFPGEGRGPGGEAEETLARLDPGLRRGTIFANLNEADLTQFDSIVVTPGLPLNRHPIAARASEAKVEIIGDIELFARARAELPPHKVVGITGTNGKSTTTALVHHILTTAGVPAAMGGNIGLPILAQDPLPDGGVYVLELSSYQIDLTRSLDCDVAVLLNITPDHLDRYESFQDYADAKGRLFLMQHAKQSAVVSCSSDEAVRQTDGIDHFIAYVATDIYPEDQSNWPALQGPHNLENAMVAWNACDLLDIPDLSGLDIETGLRTYPGLPHRMERVLDREGVLFINDSKATNAEAAAPALAAYPRVRWIVGGQAKAETLGDTAKHLDHVVKAYAIGEAGAMFARLLREAKVEVVEAGTLDKAVALAAQEAMPGETVLLSPAAASFDQFRDFEDRGDRFRDLVRAL